MTEVATAEGRPKRHRKNGVAGGPVLVTSTALAVHFGVTQPYVSKLAADGVIERRADGLFDQDQLRLKYMTHLRSEGRKSARTEADAAHVKVKVEMLQLRLMERRRDLVRREEFDAMIDGMAGLVLTKLNGLPARIAGHDLGARRRAELVVIELRRELSQAASRMADEAGGAANE